MRKILSVDLDEDVFALTDEDLDADDESDDGMKTSGRRRTVSTLSDCAESWDARAIETDKFGFYVGTPVPVGFLTHAMNTGAVIQ